MTKDLVAANRYAEALFQVARPLGKDEQIEAALEDFSTALKGAPELEKFLLNPKVGPAQRRQVFAKLYANDKTGIEKFLPDFFEVLFRKNRFNLVHDIAVSFKRIADQAQGQAVAQIRSAVALSAAQEREIVLKIEKIAGCTITVEKEIDSSLIGGVCVKIRNKVLDGSLRHKIDGIKKELTKIGKI